MAVCISAVTHCSYDKILLYTRAHAVMNDNCLLVLSVNCAGCLTLHDFPSFPFLLWAKRSGRRGEDSGGERRKRCDQSNRTMLNLPRLKRCRELSTDFKDKKRKETAGERENNYFYIPLAVEVEKEHGTNILNRSTDSIRVLSPVSKVSCSTGRPDINHYPHSYGSFHFDTPRKKKTL